MSDKFHEADLVAYKVSGILNEFRLGVLKIGYECGLTDFRYDFSQPRRPAFYMIVIDNSLGPTLTH